MNLTNINFKKQVRFIIDFRIMIILYYTIRIKSFLYYTALFILFHFSFGAGGISIRFYKWL